MKRFIEIYKVVLALVLLTVGFKALSVVVNYDTYVVGKGSFGDYVLIGVVAFIMFIMEIVSHNYEDEKNEKS